MERTINEPPKELSMAEIDEVAGGMFLELAIVHYLAYRKHYAQTHAACGCPLGT